MKRSPRTPPAHLRLPPFTDQLPHPIFFRTEHMPADATYPALCHSWGEFVYSFSGITEVIAGNQHYLVPPHLGIWIAPNTEHTGFNHQSAVHCSLYVASDLCEPLWKQSCAVIVTPLMRAILDHLRAAPVTTVATAATVMTPERDRLLSVLVDQLATCDATGSFIPHASDPTLGRIVEAFRDDPADNRTLSELAAAFNIGERTLMRRAQEELGMSLTELRQRLRVVQALALLSSGSSVEAVALDLGYATSSAFIAMFRRLTGSSPGHFAQRPDL